MLSREQIDGLKKGDKLYFARDVDILEVNILEDVDGNGAGGARVGFRHGHGVSSSISLAVLLNGTYYLTRLGAVSRLAEMLEHAMERATSAIAVCGEALKNLLKEVEDLKND